MLKLDNINCFRRNAFAFVFMLAFSLLVLNVSQAEAGGRPGECGLASGTEFGTAPTNKAALCARGVASAVALNGSNKWVWTCNGSNGTNAVCQADNCGPPPSASANCGGSYRFYSSSPSTAINDMTCTSDKAPRSWDKGTSSSHSSAVWLNEGELIDTYYKTAQCVTDSSCAPPPGSCTFNGDTYSNGAIITGSHSSTMCGNGEFTLRARKCCNGTVEFVYGEICGNAQNPAYACP